MHRLQGMPSGVSWNDLREEVGINHGIYDNPLDLTPDSLTVMRFTEWVNPGAGLYWRLLRGRLGCRAGSRSRGTDLFIDAVRPPTTIERFTTGDLVIGLVIARLLLHGSDPSSSISSRR